MNGHSREGGNPQAKMDSCLRRNDGMADTKTIPNKFTATFTKSTFVDYKPYVPQ
jgi:hypothetical protein